MALCFVPQGKIINPGKGLKTSHVEWFHRARSTQWWIVLQRETMNWYLMRQLSVFANWQLLLVVYKQGPRNAWAWISALLSLDAFSALQRGFHIFIYHSCKRKLLLAKGGVPCKRDSCPWVSCSHFPGQIYSFWGGHCVLRNILCYITKWCGVREVLRTCGFVLPL